jgi:hypothetical protein
MVSDRIEQFMLSAAAVVAVLMGITVVVILGTVLLLTRFFH